MANGLFDNYKENLWGGGNHSTVVITTANLKFILVDHGVTTPNLTTHEDHADLSSAVVTNGTSGNLASKTITDGAFDFADFSFTSVSGSSAESLVLYRDSGTSSTSNLMVYIDTATGLPITPNGNNIDVTVNASGFVTL